MKVLVFTNMFPTRRFPFYGSFVSDEVQALREAGADVDVYFVNGRENKLAYLGMPVGFRKRMARNAYDVVHVHHSFCAAVAVRQRAVPVVWTFHEGEISDDQDVVTQEGWIKRLAYSKRFKRRAAERVARVIVVAEHLAEPLGRADAVTLPSGIDTDLFKPGDTAAAKKQLGLDESKRYILFPSTPARAEKRFPLAQKAVSRLGDTDIELICLDDVPHTRVPDYMNASELMLMTSAFEASPVTIREALACNLPVVSTDVGDAKTILAGIAGCTIVEPDPDRIAAELEVALSAPYRVDAREKMMTYSLSNTARRLLEIYESVSSQWSRP